MPTGFHVVALIAAYNEADIIEQVISDLIAQGIEIYFMDDSSTDVILAVVERYSGRGVIGIERLTETLGDAPAKGFAWERILLRKAALARELDANWFIHHDADEFRESPWAHDSLKVAIRRVDDLGFNAIDSTRLDFWPVHDEFRPGDDVRQAFTFYALPAAYDRLQIRCWKKTSDLVDLASTGGHEVRFSGRKVFPLRFILRHYPIRGQAHGDRKVFEERRSRFLERERANGWHIQYDSLSQGESFIRDPSTMTPYDPDAVRIALAIHHRDVEALQESLGGVEAEVETLRRALEQRNQELAASRTELVARNADVVELRNEVQRCAAQMADLRRDLEHSRDEAMGFRHDLEKKLTTVERLQRLLDSRHEEAERLGKAVEDGARQLEAFRRSLSWRWTSPARAVYRALGGR